MSPVQFNLGFILARLGEDVFIVDQHAADEKFNFERFQQTLSLGRQPLLQPKRLEELCAMDEMIIRCVHLRERESAAWCLSVL